MHITRHAQTRCQQRSISSEAIALALDFGHTNRSRDRATVYTLTDRAIDATGLQVPARLRGVSVVEVDGNVVTVWKNARPRNRGEGRRIRERVRQRETEFEARDWFADSFDEPVDRYDHLDVA